MTEMASYMIENPNFEPYKQKKRYYNSSTMLSIFLSIFTYILIFYVFELSPSSVFKNTKALFFISNTLILIIAVDYGAFNDRETTDFSTEYTLATAAMRSRSDNNYYPIPVSTYRENPRQRNSSVAEIKNPNEEEPMLKEMLCVSPPEKIVRVVNEERKIDDVVIEKFKPGTDQTVVRGEFEARDERNYMNPKPYGRSKSDKPRRMKITEDRKTKRKSYGGSKESDSSKWMVVPEKWENVEEESEEFSKMSNEELNKRVEDFIQRFNRQMRLQSRALSK